MTEGRTVSHGIPQMLHTHVCSLVIIFLCPICVSPWFECSSTEGPNKIGSLSLPIQLRTTIEPISGQE
jgi:hypothetical protein